MRPLFATLPLLLTLAFAATVRADSAETNGEQTKQTLETSDSVAIDYLLYLPQDYESQEQWPLVLFLHGAGERGNDLKLVQKHGPPKLIEAGKQFPFILVSPQCPKDERWEPAELTALLDEVVKTHNVDEDRIYVTGLSMGGYGTWSLAAHDPERFAAIAPICGGGDPSTAKSIAHIPAWVFHGAKDPVVPLESSEEMVEALKKAGGDPKFTIYPEAEHDSWTVTYDNPEFYEWLLKQEREKGSGEAGDRGKKSRES